MAKAKKAQAKPKGIQVRPSHMFHDGELFIAYTFKRKAREMFDLSVSESESLFSESLEKGLIRIGRIVQPGIQAYTTGPEAGVVEMPPKEKTVKKS